MGSNANAFHHGSVFERGNALDAAEAAFDLLMQGPEPLSIDGRQFGNELPGREIDLRELRELLLDRQTELEVRDAVWAELVRQSRKHGGAWTVGCVGIALPGLKRIASRVTRDVPAALAEDIISDLLVAFLSGLATLDLDRHSIAPRLLWLAKRAAVRTRRKCTVDLPTAPEDLPRNGSQDSGHEDFVLADAVAQGVITGEEAELIGRTRLERVPLSQVARELGTPARRLYHLRESAEKRLVAAIDDGKVTANSHADLRNQGC
ncbi:sigma-70 RNA polymerase sigma factor region 4 domain-containing protein [Actinomadura harenae]|uniref:Sigma-70 family RNA polymerase sigma factor n=1 Tax=Actinomadura harenae TaxID=2483351 RepID=A0A3M2LKF1_9ACTN|nr:sigma factor [Actinomadura harenae]RMI36993.1 sigma-70 family RNA polymerase sigma factor [Actinomadura harenae]